MMQLRRREEPSLFGKALVVLHETHLILTIPPRRQNYTTGQVVNRTAKQTEFKKTGIDL